MKMTDCVQIPGAVFYKKDSTAEEVAQAGEELFKLLHQCQKLLDLNKARLHKFCEKVASSTSYVDPATLPPTSNAARFHSFRVYHQVQEWLGNTHDPLQWGWNFVDGKYGPIMFDQAPAPKRLMEAMP